MAAQDWSGKGSERRHEETVPAGSTSDPILVNPRERPTVIAIPGSGGTALVEVSYSSHDDIDAGTATWEDWAVGPVSARTSLRLAGEARGLRFKATTADADFEVIA